MALLPQMFLEGSCMIGIYAEGSKAKNQIEVLDYKVSFDYLILTTNFHIFLR